MLSLLGSLLSLSALLSAPAQAVPFCTACTPPPFNPSPLFQYPQLGRLAVGRKEEPAVQSHWAQQMSTPPPNTQDEADFPSYLNRMRAAPAADAETWRYCPGGADWCDKPLRYPAHQISSALARQSEVVASVFMGNKEPVVLARSGELPQELAMENVCPTITSHERPKAARNKAGQFRFIVNGGEGLEQYTQLVRMERCSQAGAGCRGLARTECKQGFTDIKLVALDPDGKELIIDTFSFPSCCSCYVSRSLEI